MAETQERTSPVPDHQDHSDLRSAEHLRRLQEWSAQLLEAQFKAIRAAGHPFEEAPVPDRGLLDAGLNAQQRAIAMGQRCGSCRISRLEELRTPVALHDS
jgi:hypothetical protein